MKFYLLSACSVLVFNNRFFVCISLTGWGFFWGEGWGAVIATPHQGATFSFSELERYFLAQI